MTSTSFRGTNIPILQLVKSEESERKVQGLFPHKGFIFVVVLLNLSIHQVFLNILENMSTLESYKVIWTLLEINP